MSEENYQRSCIKTECSIPIPTVLKFVLSLYPEIAEDARIENVRLPFNSGSVVFTIEHTQQPVKQAGPILLTPPNDDVPDAEMGE